MTSHESILRTAEASPRFRARVAGVFYLLTFVGGVFAAVWGRRPDFYGDAANLIADASYVVSTVLLYFIFRPVSRSVAIVAALFSIAGCAIGALRIFHVAVVHENPLVFFGVYCLLIGYLIIRSSFMPRVLGVLMVIAGVGWLTFLWPEIALAFSPFVMAVGALCEGSLVVWLIAVGLDEARWIEQLSAAGNVSRRAYA